MLDFHFNVSPYWLSQQTFLSVSSITIRALDTVDDFLNDAKEVVIIGTNERGEQVVEKMKFSGRDVQTEYLYCVDCEMFGEIAHRGVSGPLDTVVMDYSHLEHRTRVMIETTQDMPTLRDRVRCWRQLKREAHEQQ